MIRISITAAAFEAIAALPFGSAVFGRDPDAKASARFGLSGPSWIAWAPCAGQARATAT